MSYHSFPLDAPIGAAVEHVDALINHLDEILFIYGGLGEPHTNRVYGALTAAFNEGWRESRLQIVQDLEKAGGRIV